MTSDLSPGESAPHAAVPTTNPAGRPETKGRRSPTRPRAGLGALILIAAGITATMIVLDSLRPYLLPAPVLDPYAPSTAVPPVRFEAGNGHEIDLQEFAGQVVLFNVWATWCLPCRDEMPSLDNLEHRLGGPDFAVVAVATDAGGAATVRAFYDRLGIRSLAVYVERTGAIAHRLRVTGLPTTILIDRNGREVGRTLGAADWNDEDAIALIRRHIAASAT